jgi:hypothetical protein
VRRINITVSTLPDSVLALAGVMMSDPRHDDADERAYWEWFHRPDRVQQEERIAALERFVRDFYTLPRSEMVAKYGVSILHARAALDRGAVLSSPEEGRIEADVRESLAERAAGIPPTPCSELQRKPATSPAEED